MAVNKKKLSREAKRNHLMKADLENAIESLDRRDSRQYLESDIYKQAIRYDSAKLWEVADKVRQFEREMSR